MPPQDDLLALWAFPALIFAFLIYRAIRIGARIKARRAAWAAMTEAERQAARDESNRRAPIALVATVLVMAALLAYEFSLGACRAWNPLS